MNKKHVKGWAKHWDFILLDIFTLQLSFCLAYWCLHDFHNPYTDLVVRYLAILFLVCQLVVILFSSNYSGILRRDKYEELYAVGKYTIMVLSMATVYLFASKTSNHYSRLQTGFTVLIYLALDWVVRVVVKRSVRKQIIASRGRNSLVVVTAARLATDVLKKLFRNNTYCDFHVSRVILLDEELPLGFPTKLPIGENEDPMMKYGAVEYYAPVSLLNERTTKRLTHEWVDEVFLFQPDDMLPPMKLMEDLMTMGITVNYTTEAIDRWPNTDIRKMGQFKVLTIGHRFASAGALAVKRVADILGGIIGCILTGIIFLFVAPAIYLADPGPIFFTQERIGQNGKRFKIHKFRSMYMDAEEHKAELMEQNKMQGLMFKVEDDPRILGSEKKDRNGKPKGIGNFIRRTSLDEFPQFYDCLIGNLSMVGWRPATLDEWNRYTTQHRIRASMKPGITGLWQVSGRSKITDFDEIVRLDREYIETWSLTLDLKILIKTVVAVFLRDGAM